jgi:hypothetical protein
MVGERFRQVDIGRGAVTSLPSLQDRFTAATVPGINGFRKNGSKKEPTIQIPIVTITKANYTRLFRDNWIKKSDVCVGEFAQFC